MVQTQIQYEEEHKRELVSVWAYAYEILNESIVDDATFDRVCKEIDLNIDTGNVKLDQWFKENFDPCTGQWIWKHPDLKQIKQKAEKICDA